LAVSIHHHLGRKKNERNFSDSYGYVIIETIPRRYHGQLDMRSEQLHLPCGGKICCVLESTILLGIIWHYFHIIIAQNRSQPHLLLLLAVEWFV
jgi:hypothetical protein